MFNVILIKVSSIQCVLRKKKVVKATHRFFFPSSGILFIMAALDTETALGQKKDGLTTLHTFGNTEIGCSYSCQVLEMVDSMYVWVGKAGNPAEMVMVNFVTSCNSKYDKSRPLTTSIMDGPFDSKAEALSQRLSQRTGKHIFVSYNVDCSDDETFLIEKNIVENMKGLDLL